MYTLLPFSSLPHSFGFIAMISRVFVSVSLSLCVCGPNAFRPPDKQIGVFYIILIERYLFERKQIDDTNSTLSEAKKKVTVILFFPRHGPMFCLLFVPYIFSICLTKLTMKYFGACGRIKYLWGCTYISMPCGRNFPNSKHFIYLDKL